MLDSYARLNLDTHKVVKLLQERGYSQESAEGFIEAVQEIALTGVATKQDVVDLDKRVSALEAKLNMLIWMVGINMTMTAGILLALVSGIVGG